MAGSEEEKKALRRENGRKWYAANKERRLDKCREWYAANKELHAEMTRRWRGENKERVVAIHMVVSARKRAAKRGLPFDLDARTDDLQEIIMSKACHYTGLPFNVGGGLTWDSPSLDRVEPELGYVWSNVRVVLNCINMFKGSSPLDKMCFVAEHLLDWQAAKAAQTAGSVLLSDQQKPTEE